ncbi:Lipoate-protein ligase LplJ [Desulfosarcina cetonica]|nr:Lipoate-protein ligase LplJ [Desulfosarcina cetonica]
MYCFTRTETDPAFNLAAEEYLLKNADEDCFMLWRNHKAIIVGRNQNTLSEINPDFVDRHGIRVVRRITGGGAVYHDLGNVNFTFIKANGGKKEIDFAAYTRPILDYLNTLAVPAKLDGRNDLIVEGLKISGNAQHIHKQRVLHHGTLLFDVDLEMLAAVLLVDPAKYTDKAIQSIRSRVTNISEHLVGPMDVETFMDDLTTHIRKAHAGKPGHLSADDRAAIEDLAEQKYRRWEWNFGSSPEYNFRRVTRTPGGTIEVCLDVRDGVIHAARFYGDYFGKADIADIEVRLVGCQHRRSALQKRLDGVFLTNYIKDVSMDQLLDAMF